MVYGFGWEHKKLYYKYITRSRIMIRTNNKNCGSPKECQKLGYSRSPIDLKVAQIIKVN